MKALIYKPSLPVVPIFKMKASKNPISNAPLYIVVGVHEPLERLA